MRILAFDTSSPRSAVAVVDGERVLAEDDSPSEGRHGDVLLPRIYAELTRAQLGLRALDLIAVGVGPGSFTGIRVGLATAKGLALATPTALIGVCSLCVIARAITEPAGLLVAVLDAGKGDLFGAAFRPHAGKLETVLSPVCARPEELARALAALAFTGDTALCGDGAAKHLELFRGALGARSVFHAVTPRGRDVAAEARERYGAEGPSDPATLVPVYLRGSDAKLPSDPLRLG